MSKHISYGAQIVCEDLNEWIDEDKGDDKLEFVDSEKVCPNCGLIDQNPEYQSICSFCGHLK